MTTATPRLPGTRSFLRFIRPSLPGFGLVASTFVISNVATAIIPLSRLGRPFTGKVRIVTLGTKPVRIDGLGVSTL